MRFKEEDINVLYLGVCPSKTCKINNADILVNLLSSKDILKIQREADIVYPDNEKLRIVYFSSLVAYHSTNLFDDYNTFVETFSINDIDIIVKAHDELIEDAPKIEWLDEEDIEDIAEYLRCSPMQRYKWSLCEKFSSPPNILFGTGNYLTDEQVLWCFIMEKIDRDEKMEHWCDECKEKLNDENRCWNCGQPIIRHEENTSSTFDDTEWLRKAYGVWNEQTQRFEIPEGYTFDDESKAWIKDEEQMVKPTSSVSCVEPIDDLVPTEPQIEDDEGYIEDDYEPDKFDDFTLSDNEDED